jgi:hypothetical protein
MAIACVQSTIPISSRPTRDFSHVNNQEGLMAYEYAKRAHCFRLDAEQGEAAAVKPR